MEDGRDMIKWSRKTIFRRLEIDYHCIVSGFTMLRPTQNSKIGFSDFRYFHRIFSKKCQMLSELQIPTPLCKALGTVVSKTTSIWNNYFATAITSAASALALRETLRPPHRPRAPRLLHPGARGRLQTVPPLLVVDLHREEEEEQSDVAKKL